jgi:hypothetical protein
MGTRTIPEEQWAEFFDRFSHEHAGWPVTIEVPSGCSGVHTIAARLPLQSISLEAEGNKPRSLEISVGDQPNRAFSHIVDRPQHVRQAEQTTGSIDLQIEPANGPVTRVHVRSHVLE